MSKPKCRIEPADDGEGYLFKTPYIADFVADLKRELPKWSRLWQPDIKRWYIDELYIEEAADIAARYYEIIGLPETAHDSAWSVLHLEPGAPPEIVKAVYRALAKLHHPDLGGDTRAMQRINSAFEQLTDGR